MVNTRTMAGAKSRNATLTAPSAHAAFRRAVPVRAAEPVSLKPRLQHFLRAVVRQAPDGAEAM